MIRKKKFFRLLIFIVCLFYYFNSPELLKGFKDSHGLLKVVFFNVGQGDSFLICSPNNRNLLIDGGLGFSDYSDFDAGQLIIVPYLQKKEIRCLDTIVLTHPHSDHLGGLFYIIRNMEIKRIMDAGAYHDSMMYRKFVDLIYKKKLKYQPIRAGDNIDLDTQVKLRVLHPSRVWESDNLNDNSLVLRLEYKQISFLFTADISRLVEDYLVKKKILLRSTVLKVPHHGSEDSSSLTFIKAVSPDMAVISVGKKKQGFPAEIVVKRYKDNNVKVLRTDHNGWIEIITDGLSYHVRCQKDCD